MPATVHDVAKRAGVSVGSVSRYLNGYMLKDENMRKIRCAIDELGFKQNIIAKGLKNNRSMTIGVMLGSITDIFATSIVSALQKRLGSENYSVMLGFTDENEDKTAQNLEFLLDRSIDGLILFDGHRLKGLDMEVLNKRIPVLVIDDKAHEFEADEILVDNADSSFRAIEKLIHENHKRIAIINGTKGRYNTSERFRGYTEALGTYGIGLDESLVKYGNYISSGGYLAAKELLASEQPPTAIYVTNYYMTLGAMMAMNELNIKVPEEISLIGFDYFELSDVIKPALTVIEQDTRKIGELAAEVVLKRIRGDFSEYPSTVEVKTRMILRDSIRRL